MTGRFARRGGSSRRWVFRAAWCLIPVVYAILAGRAFAQHEPAAQSAGTIRGTVKDSSGAVVAGAVVTLEAAGSTQQQQTTITDQAGQFRFSPF